MAAAQGWKRSEVVDADMPVSGEDFFHNFSNPFEETVKSFEKVAESFYKKKLGRTPDIEEGLSNVCS